MSMPEYGLVAKKVKTQNHPARPAVDVPKFWKRLDMSDVRHRCIGFLILTAARREKAVGATSAEIDLQNAQ
jgi:hypothetical protein